MGFDFALGPTCYGVSDAAQKAYGRGKISEPGGYEELPCFVAD
jgi:hypothetical protein